ncbi:MAG TPA: general secretion pathway protein GspB [Woeseiaceae bacterium]|nr:general secretion pathway protein GspB [Woeseiaceae bacterium]
MSFILDALKKSEAERQRKSVPGFADIPDARSEPRAQRWWWIIGGLLTINAAVLSSVFLIPDRDEATEAAPVQQAAATRQPVREPAPATATPVPFAEIVAEAKKNRPPQDVPTTTEPQRQDPAPATTPANSRVTMSEQLATINEVRAEGSLQLPELHLDIHVYSEKPPERFVFINMSKYKEGDTLSEGLAVREIRTDGVVLEQGGTRFLMPRQ